MKNRQGLQSAKRLFILQLGLTLVLSLIVFCLSSGLSALSVMLGGLLSAIPHLFFASVVFRHHGALAAKQILAGFYKGEALKMVLTMGLFIVVFSYVPLVPLVFFIAYLVAQGMIWLAPLLIQPQLSHQFVQSR